MGYIRGDGRSQGTLFPVVLDDLVPADHVCRVIDAFVDKLAMKEFGFERAEAADTGRPGYDPRDLLKLYLYGYLNQIRSSRRLEQECLRNVELMWLLGRLYPDHISIAEFRRMHREAITAAGARLVGFAKQCGLIRGEWIAIDGSKFRAVSSIDTVRERIQLQRYLDSMEQSEAEQQESIDSSAVVTALQKLNQHPEPDAGFMLMRSSTAPAFNMQSAADSKHAIIVAHEVVLDAADSLLAASGAVLRLLHDVEVTEPKVVEHSRCNGEGVEWIIVVHVVEVDGRRDSHTHLLAVPDFEHPFDCLLEKACSIRTGTSVIIGSPVRFCAEELIDQISIRRVNFDPVEACLFRVAGGTPVVRQDLCDPTSGQSHWLRYLSGTGGNVRVRVSTDCRRSNGLSVVWQQGRMRDSADMPQLKEDSASALVNGIDDSAPRPHLVCGMNPRSVAVAFTHRRDLRRLGHDESSRSSLRIVGRRKFAWHAVVVRAGTRKRGHEDAVCQKQRA